MRYLKTYNEQTKYVEDILKFRKEFDVQALQYISKIEDCVLYLTDICKTYEIEPPSLEEEQPYFHVNLYFDRGTLEIDDELVSNVERSISKLKSDINADDFTVAIELNTDKETTYHQYFDTPHGTNTISDISKLVGEITLISISFK